MGAIILITTTNTVKKNYRTKKKYPEGHKYSKFFNHIWLSHPSDLSSDLLFVPISFLPNVNLRKKNIHCQLLTLICFSHRFCWFRTCNIIYACHLSQLSSLEMWSVSIHTNVSQHNVPVKCCAFITYRNTILSTKNTQIIQK